MVTVAERPTSLIGATPFAPRAGESAAVLAGACRDWASACWRGEQRASHFATRMGAYWHPDLPPRPVEPPDAISVHGAGGRGIHWYEIGAEVRGYVPGARGGYQVPIAAVPQLARCIILAPPMTDSTVAQGKGQARFQSRIAQRDQAYEF